MLNTDSTATKSKNVFSAGKLFSLKAITFSQWVELAAKSDDKIDLIDKRKAQRSWGNWKPYAASELVQITNTQGYEIVKGIFGGRFDGKTISKLKSRNPRFFLQMASSRELRTFQ